VEKPVVLENLGQQMIGMLHLPEVPGPVPAVAIYHGFTGTKIEPHRIFVKMARALNALGIAAVRFDFRGSGDSEGDFADMTVTGEISDAVKILDFLAGLPEVDASRLGILGLSMGGAVAATVAGIDARVKSLTLWSAVADFKIFERDPEAIELARKQGYLDVSGNVLKMDFYEDIQKQKPAETVGNYRGAALIVHGDADPTVPVSHADIYEKALSVASRVDKFILPGADHTYNRMDWEKAVIERTAAWFKETL
jgi:dipeptidyl aminopeptidase/acylaminoacyl peptidase